MARLVKKSQKFIKVDKKVISLIHEILHMELSSSIRYKFYEFTTTGIFHDAIVPNFNYISEADADHAWELCMLLSSYGQETVVPAIEIGSYKTVKDYLNAMVEVKKNLIAKYDELRSLLSDKKSSNYDIGAVLVIENIMSEERINMSELLKLLDQHSLKGI